MPKTSIIIPVYNTADYLYDCFDSVFSQTQWDIEVIAINDGSTDNSLQILEKIKAEHPNMILYSQENQGLGSARNKGMELATGEYIYFMDSDDCLTHDAMEMCYSHANKYNLDMVMFDAVTFGNIEFETGYYDRSRLIDEQYIVFDGISYANKYWLKRFYPSACLIYTSAKFIKEYNLKFTPRIFYEDNIFHLKMIPLAKRIMYIPQAFYKRRYRENSIMTQYFDLRHGRDFLEMIKIADSQGQVDEVKNVTNVWKIEALCSLTTKSIYNGLLEDKQFSKELRNMVYKIVLDTLDTASTYRYIAALYNLVKIVPVDMQSLGISMENISYKWKNLLSNLFCSIHLNIPDNLIGIYGMGKNTERFLSDYIEVFGDIKASVHFIDSNEVSFTRKFRGCDIINVKDIGNYNYDCIVIASRKFEGVMYNTVKTLYGDKYNIIRLGWDLDY
jgi:glycosyltransferase involved in cell wall biosynthesis